MSKFYVYCYTTGQKVNGYFSNKSDASKFRREYIKENPDRNAKVINEYSVTKYGQTVSALRLAK